MEDALKRFLKHTNQVSGIFGQDGNFPTQCWEWLAALTHDGYGRFSIKRKHIMAHVFAYKYFVGQIQKNLTIDHLCKNRSCVNPDHLEQVTLLVNLHRGNTLQAKNKAKTHCPYGHEYDQNNTFIRPNGGRTCRKCARLRANLWEKRNSEYRNKYKKILRNRRNVKEK